MNRRLLRYGMRVGYIASRYATPQRAVVARVDTSDGYGAQHLITFCDDEWKVIKSVSTGEPRQMHVTSRQLKPWDEVDEGVAEREFQQTQAKIVAEIAARKREEAAKPYEELVNVLTLLGVTDAQYTVGYGHTFFNLRIPADQSTIFMDLVLPYLTERLMARTMGPAQELVETPAEPDCNLSDFDGFCYDHKQYHSTPVGDSA
jgi:hypothetical protein